MGSGIEYELISREGEIPDPPVLEEPTTHYQIKQNDSYNEINAKLDALLRANGINPTSIAQGDADV